MCKYDYGIHPFSKHYVHELGHENVKENGEYQPANVQFDQGLFVPYLDSIPIVF